MFRLCAIYVFYIPGVFIPGDFSRLTNARIPRRVVLIRDVFSITRIRESARNLAPRYFFSPLSPFLPFSSFWKRAALDARGERERKIRRGRGNSYRGGTFRRPIISRNFEENGAAIPSSLFFSREHEQHKGESAPRL